MKPNTNEIQTAEFAPLAGWMAISGMNRSACYSALGRGDLKAVKLGRRVLINVPAGLAWLKSLPAPDIRPASHVARPETQ
jgi:hypothetical protein